MLLRLLHGYTSVWSISCTLHGALLKYDDEGCDIAPELEDLLLELESILKRISASAGSEASPIAIDQANVSDSTVAELMIELISLLENFDVAAVKLIPRIKAQTNDDSVNKTIEEIDVLLDQYDFDGALALAVEVDTESI